MFEFDRAAFEIKTFEEADSNILYWITRPPEERLRAADELIRRVYGLAPSEPRKVIRRLTGIKRHGMANLFGTDFHDFFAALNKAEVE